MNAIRPEMLIGLAELVEAGGALGVEPHLVLGCLRRSKAVHAAHRKLPRLDLLDPQAVMITRPVAVDMARAHRSKGSLHAHRADIDVRQDDRDEDHRHDRVDDHGELLAGDVGDDEREHQGVARDRDATGHILVRGSPAADVEHVRLQESELVGREVRGGDVRIDRVIALARTGAGLECVHPPDQLRHAPDHRRSAVRVILRGGMRLPLRRHELVDPGHGRLAERPRLHGLGQGVPAAAVTAAPGPLREPGATGITGIACLGLGHGCCVE